MCCTNHSRPFWLVALLWLAVVSRPGALSADVGCPVGRYFAQPDVSRLKTNLAYDLFAVLNVAGEFKVSEHLSVEIPVAWSLWDWKKTLGLRCVALQPGARYYLCPGGSGHAVGADLILLWYNFRKDSRRYQSASRPAAGLEVNYSYTLPIERHLLLEFLVGVGWVNTRHNIYYNIDNGAMTGRSSHNYFGPTRVGISLVYAF